MKRQLHGDRLSKQVSVALSVFKVVTDVRRLPERLRPRHQPQLRDVQLPPAQPVRRPPPKIASNQESEAVKRLRAANEAAAAASDEAFALNDAVEARLASWKAGKEGNLRALLASLDTILWADAGWKKVGMGDLVMPNKVKIIYMKAIGKVHPDKVC